MIFMSLTLRAEHLIPLSILYRNSVRGESYWSVDSVFQKSIPSSFLSKSLDIS